MKKKSQQPLTKIENETFQIIAFTTNEINKFNKDLQQICHALEYKFLNIVYTYSFQLLAKLYEEKQW